VGRALVVALAVHGAAQVVDDDLGALMGQQQRVLTADAASCARDDGDATLTQLGHPCSSPWFGAPVASLV
jgi:hypothetical protein